MSSKEPNTVQFQINEYCPTCKRSRGAYLFVRDKGTAYAATHAQTTFSIQGNHADAHYVFEQGIPMVTPDDPLYMLLNELGNQAKM
ncbi:hypothetical protein BJV82DRAFT_663608 [Fennellomyces sp. T-0311]|nr:hypothetical protein BJV82DRAFT_663608 [Fennellomyces sp. T-0311]